MDAAPLVSVLMTCYNAGTTIAKSIESVLSQSYSNWELLILDDVSTDNTRAVIDSFPDKRIRRIYNSQNIGYAASKNVLLSEMKGAFGCFLDADDWMHEDRIQEQLRFLLENPEVGACICAYVRVSPDGLETVSRLFQESKLLDHNKGEVHFAGAGMMFRQEVIDAIGGFEPYFNRLIGDDAYWAIRIAEQFKFYYLNVPLYYYTYNEASMTNTFDNPRMHSIIELLHELKRQRLVRHTDWLEEKNYEAAMAYEHALLNNRKWVSEKLRHAAAVRLDFLDFETASDYLKRSFVKNPFNTRLYRTLIYYVRLKAREGSRDHWQKQTSHLD